MLYIQLCSQDQNLNCANFLYLDSSHCTEPRLCLLNSLHKIKILIVHTFCICICIWIHRIALNHVRACSSFCTRSKSCAYIICMSCGFLRRYEMFKSSSQLSHSSNMMYTICIVHVLSFPRHFELELGTFQAVDHIEVFLHQTERKLSRRYAQAKRWRGTRRALYILWVDLLSLSQWPKKDILTSDWEEVISQNCTGQAFP